MTGCEADKAWVVELLIKMCLIELSKSHFYLQNNSVLQDVNQGNMAVVGIIYVPEGRTDKDALVSNNLDIFCPKISEQLSTLSNYIPFTLNLESLMINKTISRN